MNLHIALDQETDGRWMAEVAALPGVMTYGVTPADATAKVQALALRVLAERLEHGEAVPAWAELLERTFAVDVLVCPSCQGRMRLLAAVKNPVSITRYLAAAGELTEVPNRGPGRGPPYWKSQVLHRQAFGDDTDGGEHGRGDEAA